MGEYILDPEPIYAPDFLDKYGLSAHSLITPAGDNIRCRLDDEIAWHARGYNTNSLGCEVLVSGKHDYGSFIEAIKYNWLTETQYKALLYQVREWLELYPIKRIAKHSDLSPGRKVDPGNGFDWLRFCNDLGADYAGVIR